LLAAHLNLYSAYVGKLNEIEQRLASAGRTAASAIYNDYSELRRREVAALNGVVLHELYFSSLAPAPLNADLPVGVALGKAFGGLEAWQRDFRAAATSTDGWLLLTLSQVDGALHHYALQDEQTGVPLRQDLLLAIDCSEHAYALDYGGAKQDYLAAALGLIDWSLVQTRYGALATGA
jgi:Fe-Mn family superoxide dismutase